MNSAWGIGIIVGGLTLSAWGGFKKRIVTSLVGLTGMGIGFLLVGLAPATAFWLLCPLLGLLLVSEGAAIIYLAWQARKE